MANKQVTKSLIPAALKAEVLSLIETGLKKFENGLSALEQEVHRLKSINIDTVSNISNKKFKPMPAKLRKVVSKPKDVAKTKVAKKVVNPVKKAKAKVKMTGKKTKGSKR